MQNPISNLWVTSFKALQTDFKGVLVYCQLCKLQFISQKLLFFYSKRFFLLLHLYLSRYVFSVVFLSRVPLLTATGSSLCYALPPGSFFHFFSFFNPKASSGEQDTKEKWRKYCEEWCILYWQCEFVKVIVLIRLSKRNVQQVWNQVIL